MSSTNPDQPSHVPEDGTGRTPFIESEMRHGDDSAPVRSLSRIPVWLLPTLGALAAGLLVGYFVFGGTEAPAPRPVAAPPTSSDEPQVVSPVVTSLARAEPVAIDIPVIEVSSSLVDLGLNGDGTLEVPVDFAKAGWFTGGNYPGDPQGPPGLIAGHVDDVNGPAVFYRLTELAVGAEVLITRADNTVAVFAVTESQQYPKDALPTDEIYAPVGDSEIVLITCTGDFDQSARSYQDNFVVRATLDMARSLEESDKRIAAGMVAPDPDQPNI